MFLDNFHNGQMQLIITIEFRYFAHYYYNHTSVYHLHSIEDLIIFTQSLHI